MDGWMDASKSLNFLLPSGAMCWMVSEGPGADTLSLDLWNFPLESKSFSAATSANRTDTCFGAWRA